MQGRAARARTVFVGGALAVLGVLAMAAPAAACELDGLSHGYGPMSALFAGAHRYQSLNGLEDEESPPEPPPPVPTEPAAADGRRTPSSAMAPTSPPATPPRSFVAWAKAAPKPAEASSPADEAPAAWGRAPVPAPDPTGKASTASDDAER